MTMFHKQHYDALAEVLNETSADQETKVKIARLFKRDNKYFKPGKFLLASGMRQDDVNAVVRAGYFE